MKRRMLKLGLFLLLGAIVIVAIVSCEDRDARLSEKITPQTGSLNRSEIVKRVETGGLIGISREELIKLCGELTTTDKYQEYHYMRVIGVCDSYAPDKQWLLIRFDGDHVVEAKIDCD